MMGPTYTIRPRTDSDLPACADAMRAVHAIDGYPVGDGIQDPHGFLQTDDKAWVAVREDGGATAAVVGHAALSRASEDDVAAALWWRLHPEARLAPNGGIFVLGRLFVHPGARGCGVATQLIKVAVAEAGGREGTIRLVMFALGKDRDAIRLYRKLGWVHYGTAVYRWGEDQQMDAECFASPET